MDVQNRAEIQSQLAAGFPVVIGMVVSIDFQNYQGGIFREQTKRFVGGHAMVVVGYSDRRNAYRVINSWGKDWGDGGFAWIDYGTFEQYVREGYVTQDIIVDPIPRPENDPADPRIEPDEAKYSQLIPVWAETKTAYVGFLGDLAVDFQNRWWNRREYETAIFDIDGEILNDPDSEYQIVLRINSMRGTRLKAAHEFKDFADDDGFIEVRRTFKPTANLSRMSAINFGIPVDAIDLSSNDSFSGHRNPNHYLRAEVDLYRLGKKIVPLKSELFVLKE